MRKCHTVFPNGCTNLYSFFHSIPQFQFLHTYTLDNICPVYLFGNIHSKSCKTLSCCGFYLYLSDNYWCSTLFHVSVGNYMSSSEKCLFRSFCPFCKWSICDFFLLLSYMNSKYTLVISPFSNIWFASIFPIP